VRSFVKSVAEAFAWSAAIVAAALVVEALLGWGGIGAAASLGIAVGRLVGDR